MLMCGGGGAGGSGVRAHSPESTYISRSVTTDTGTAWLGVCWWAGDGVRCVVRAVGCPLRCERLHASICIRLPRGRVSFIKRNCVDASLQSPPPTPSLADDCSLCDEISMLPHTCYSIFAFPVRTLCSAVHECKRVRFEVISASANSEMERERKNHASVRIRVMYAIRFDFSYFLCVCSSVCSQSNQLSRHGNRFENCR